MDPGQLQRDRSGVSRLTQFSQPATSGGKGWFGTVGLGCDYQVISSIVIGAFGDWDFGDIKGEFSPAFQNIVGTESDKWSWAAGGRIGWLVTPTVLTYFTGGYTQTHFDVVNFNSLNFPLGGPAGLSLPANTYHGWFLGSGFEYAISFLPTGFFLKSEYRYSTYRGGRPADRRCFRFLAWCRQLEEGCADGAQRAGLPVQLQPLMVER